MIEQRTLELIHAGIDGELDAGDSTELQRRLEADPEARLMNEHLAKMADALGRMAPVAPPASLQQQILQATRPAAKVLPFRDRRTQFVRYTMALAAGIAIVAVGIQFSGSSGTSLQADQLVGTIGGQPNTPSPAAVEIELNASDLKGSVGLSPGQGRLLLVFEMESVQPVKVTAAYADAAFRLNGSAPENAATGDVSATPGRIEFVSQGAQRRVLVLQPGAGGPLRISFEEQGKLLQEAVLDLPGQASTQ